MFQISINSRALFPILLLNAACGTSQSAKDDKLRVCPESYFEDRMPQIIDQKNQEKRSRAYFIYKGERRELSDFDTAWVWKNCEVPQQIVY